jgi:hypothetical protein
VEKGALGRAICVAWCLAQDVARPGVNPGV